MRTSTRVIAKIAGRAARSCTCARLPIRQRVTIHDDDVDDGDGDGDGDDDDDDVIGVF